MNTPNIVLITTDSQRWDTLRCMGSPFAISPHLDKLASEGVLFEQAHTSSPVCSPARCSLMTGLHTPIHGCIENGIRRKHPLPMFPDLLKEQGYTNLMIGKTHFGSVPDSFDIIHEVTEKSNDGDDAYAKHIRSHGYPRKSSGVPNPVPESLFMDAFLVDTAISEIERAVAEGQGPFFAFCSLVSPHEPFDPPGRFAELYDSTVLPPIRYEEGEISAFPLHLKKLLGLMADDTGERPVRNGLKHLHEQSGRSDRDERLKEVDRIRKLYYGSAAYCDEQIGRLIAYLDRSGLRENTLILFTSDHGLQMFDHGFNDKHNYYDASWRIPFIMSMPGTLPAGEKRDFAIWNDIPATLLAAAGTSSPYIQGFDLFTPLAQGLPSPRRCAVATLYKSAAIATERWKLEYYFEERKGRLFDRLADPTEHSDLYERPEYGEIRNLLVQTLLSWRSDLVDVNELIRSTSGGGPVARRIAPHTKAMRGVDSEIRLNEAIEEIANKG
ncbi:sulfatase [Paenibacillus allorhizosphaerae]|uniref:Arylsulfatase n=1 Tax=Paenibacillus allorhizosphaerae TaxID=2849866 RepID=A0ABM8V9X0_9BACL|nr:sulfatase-like hydrolase/transferase [Paenibacillus allorhizosphaerae]CAG7614611.1 Arylsulfatase [Paenibacillus allorhizosphaerae]